MTNGEILRLVGESSNEGRVIFGIALLGRIPLEALTVLTYEDYLELSSSNTALAMIHKNVKRFYISPGRRNSKYLFAGVNGQPCSSSRLSMLIKVEMGKPLAQYRSKWKGPEITFQMFIKRLLKMDGKDRAIIHKVINRLPKVEKELITQAIEGEATWKMAVNLGFCTSTVTNKKRKLARLILEMYNEEVHTVS